MITPLSSWFSISATVLTVALTATSHVVAAEIPKRVVSMNVCTDQMAMLIAGDDQLYSVSDLAFDPKVAVMASKANRYVLNHGLAEEVFLMQPDLVLAGTYTTPAAVSLLRRLGIRVEQFAPQNSFDDIRSGMMRMGEVLGRQQRAGELVGEFDRELKRLKTGTRQHLTVAAWEPNSYTSGSGTLVDAIIEASGFTNLAARLGFSGMAKLPLELLIISQPDLIAGENPNYGVPSVAQDNLVHPAYRVLAKRSHTVALHARYTICGAPFVTEASRLLQTAAHELEQGQEK